MSHFELPFTSVSEKVLVHNLSGGNVPDLQHNECVSETYLHITRTRFETEGKGNSEMAYCGCPKKCLSIASCGSRK